MTTPSPMHKLTAAALVAAGGLLVLPLGCSDAQPNLGKTDAGPIIVPPTSDSGPGGPGEGFQDGGGLTNDADIDAGFGCTTTPKGPGPLRRICRAATENECDGASEDAALPNGINGNGFDDDCDGLVDEGCRCDSAGATRDCYLVPPSQTNNVTRRPVGWCEQNAKGSIACVRQGEFNVWGGTCRGAQPPFATDKCARGDFDCDGEEQNPSGVDCSCRSDLLQCPTAPFRTAPYPSPTALPLKIDAAAWLANPSLLAQTTGWKWSLRGGDCDNIAPQPSFGLYPTPDGSGPPPGAVVSNLGPSARERGRVWIPANAGDAGSGVAGNLVYPAFSLSGDYVLDMEVEVRGQAYKCSTKIEVRSPGLRAEACWDSMGPVDVDLHMAKIDGFAQSCNALGWSDQCPNQDCFYQNCRASSAMTRWAADTAASNCVGWGSASKGSSCKNPRLDRDIVTCQPNEPNPSATGTFCGTENINIDNPPVDTQYAIATILFGGGAAKPHVNVYCNGKRVLSAGYDPLAGQNFPVLLTSAGANGDMWKVGLVNVTQGAEGIECAVETTRSMNPDPQRDGSTNFCVDRSAPNSTRWLTPSGTRPLDAGVLCFH